MSLQELAHEEVVRSVKLEQGKEVTKLRQEVEQGAKELASKYERKMKVMLTERSCQSAALLSFRLYSYTERLNRAAAAAAGSLTLQTARLEGAHSCPLLFLQQRHGYNFQHGTTCMESCLFSKLHSASIQAGRASVSTALTIPYASLRASACVCCFLHRRNAGPIPSRNTTYVQSCYLFKLHSASLQAVVPRLAERAQINEL